VLEEDIVFVTTADDDSDDDSEFISEDNIFLEDELCIPFSTSLFPCHDQDLIEDVF